MAYGNGFPVGYQPAQFYYPQQYTPTLPSQQNQPNAQQTNNSITWVQGEAGAKSYLVAPNTTVQLWDSENQVIYLKSADASGMPSMKTLDYTIREAVQPTQQTQIVNRSTLDYVTHDELSKFENEIREQLASMTTSKTRTRKEEKSNE